jgi:hypothetical protein
MAQKKNVCHVCTRYNMVFFSYPDVIEHKAMTGHREYEENERK